MDLGCFSVSLAVKNLDASREFYLKLGFVQYHHTPGTKWAIMKSGDHVIGLFEGMFEKNILTFNPGWDQNGHPVDPFVDAREIQRRLRADGVTFAKEADENTTGPASFVVVDPDGNPVMIDQHR